MKRLIAILFAFTLSLSAQELGISTNDVELSFLEESPIEPSVSLGLQGTFFEADEFVIPALIQGDLRWFRFGGDVFRFNFQTGVYYAFSIINFEDADWETNNFGISILKLEGEVKLNERATVFVNIPIVSYDFEQKELYAGYGILPYPKVGLRVTLTQ